MRGLTMTICLTAALAACATPARERPLGELDLGDPAVLRQLGGELTQRERGALATYALLHWPKSTAYCGQPVFQGPQPRTIGEAVAKTIAFEDALAAKRAAEKAPPSALEQRLEEERRLVDSFDRLTLERDMLETSPLPTNERDRRLAALDRELDANRQARRRLGAMPPPLAAR